MSGGSGGDDDDDATVSKFMITPKKRKNRKNKLQKQFHEVEGVVQCKLISANESCCC